MPLPSTLVWEVEVGGSDTNNGGGFDSAKAGSGTDYSVQTNAQVYIDNSSIKATLSASTITFTTTAISGLAAGSPTTCTTTAAPPTGTPVTIAGATGNWTAVNGNWTVTNTGATTFTITANTTGATGGIGSPTYKYNAQATDVGNVVNVLTGGAGLTAGRYSINSVSAGTSWTTNASTGAASAAMTGYMGGALASPGYAAGVMVASNVMYILYSATTYTISSASVNISGGCLSPPAQSAVIGYATNRTLFNTDANRPHLQIQAGLSTAVMCTGITVLYSNLILDGNGQTSSTISSAISLFLNCLIENCTNNGITGGIAVLCEFSGCSSNAACATTAFYCVAHGNSATSFTSTCVGCIAYANTVPPFQPSGGYSYINCIAYGNTGGTTDGFYLFANGGSMVVINCISESNGRYGFNGYSAGFQNHIAINCTGYGNGTSLLNGAYLLNTGFITVSGSVFVAPGSQNFSLNSTANAGQLLREAGYPTTWPAVSASMLQNLDIGAAQYHNWPLASSVYAGVNRGDGVLGTLHASNIATAAGAGVNLSASNLKHGVRVDDINTGTFGEPTPLDATLPGGTQNVAYSTSLSGNGGVGPYTYALTSGSLPTGLSLSTATISGTPTVLGTSTFSITITDANGYTSAVSFSITISAPSAGVTLFVIDD